MTSSELIKSHCNLHFWGEESATDIGGFDARRVGFSQETTVV